MDVFRPNLQGQDEDGVLLPSDPRLQPTPDYGSAGADSELAPRAVPGHSDFRDQPVSSLRGLHMAAMVAGVGLALAVSSAGGTGAVWGKFSRPFSLRKDIGVSSVQSSDDGDLERQKPQEQAEILLELLQQRRVHQCVVVVTGQAEAAPDGLARQRNGNKQNRS